MARPQLGAGLGEAMPLFTDRNVTTSKGDGMVPGTIVRVAAGRGFVLRLMLGMIALMLCGAPALAQDPPQVISPLRVEEDQNGVNLITGKTQLPIPTLSVPGAPNLRFDRVLNMAPYVNGQRHSPFGSYSEGSFAIHTGRSTSESFTCSFDDVCTSVTGTGSSFSPWALTFREEGTGAFWTFDQLQHQTVSGDTTFLQYYASSVVYPTGEVISYSYATTPETGVTYHRPTTISSNLGYHITISYHSNTMWTPGWAAPYQATIYRTSEPSTPLGQLTYSLDGTTITDLGSRVYTCTGCTNTFAGEVETVSGSLRLPGDSTDSIQVTTHSGGPVVGSVTRDGITWNYAYTNLHWNGTHKTWIFDTVTVTGPESFSQLYELADHLDWSGSPRRVITRVTDSLGRQTSYTYDAYVRPNRATYPESNRVDVVYGVAGNVTSRTATAKPSSGDAAITETAHYTCSTYSVACYRPVWSRDGLSRQTDYLFNAAGQQTQQDDPADANGVRRRTIHEYTVSSGLSRRTVTRVCGITTTCGTTQEIRTEYTYWNNTNLPATVAQVDPATSTQLVTTYTYDTAGRVLIEDGPLAGTADARYFYYDVHGRRIWEIDAVGANGVRMARQITYRAADDKPTVTALGTVPATVPPQSTITLTPIRRTEITYDARRNPVVQRMMSGTTTHTLVQRTFDNRNRLECETQRMNPAIYGSLPTSACTLGTEGSHGPDRITRNVYDVANQLTQIQRAYGTPLQQNYATYLYSLNGQRTRVTDANGNRADLRYDGHDRQIRWVFPHLTSAGSVNEADYEAYTYDAAGNRLTLRKRDGVTITYSYDNLNRMLVKTVPMSASGAAGYSVHYGYDLRNAQTFARFASTSGVGITNTYDAFGRLHSQANDTIGASRLLAHHYDAGSRRTALVSDYGYYASYAWAAAGQLTAVGDGAGPVVRLGYDAAGRRASLDSGVGTPSSVTSYGYDGMGRLNSLNHNLSGTSHDVAWTFAYNPANQIVTRTRDNDTYASDTAYDVTRSYTVNGLNQYTTAGGASFTYDANGNVISDGSTAYVYDAENRLVSATGASNATLAYDPLGRLFQVVSGSNTTRFHYDGDALVAEFNGSGTLLRAFVHGAGADEPLVWYEGSGRKFLRTDHQGSIVTVANDSGASVVINAYDAWGIPNAGNQGRFGYTGQIWLPEIGMWHYKARIYSPTLGRFLQTDPIGYEDQVNLYAYVRNDPVNMTDPTGLCGTRVPGHVSAGCSGETVLARIEATASGSEGNGGRRNEDRGSGTAAGSNGRVQLAGAPAVGVAALAICMRIPRCAAALVATGGVITQAIYDRFIGHFLPRPVLQDGGRDRDRRHTAPTNAPSGTRPLDRMPRPIRDRVEPAKSGLGLRPQDWTGITPDGRIIATDPETGEYEDMGHVDDYDSQ